VDRRTFLGSLSSLVVFVLGLPIPVNAQAPALATRERVIFKSGNLTLVGFLFSYG